MTEAVKEKQSYVFDRKLSDEEVRELIDNFDYEAYSAAADAEDYEPGPVWDRYGNPTVDTIAARYEVEHGLTETMTIDEFFDWMRQMYEEAE